ITIVGAIRPAEISLSSILAAPRLTSQVFGDPGNPSTASITGYRVCAWAGSPYPGGRYAYAGTVIPLARPGIVNVITWLPLAPWLTTLPGWAGPAFTSGPSSCDQVVYRFSLRLTVIPATASDPATQARMVSVRTGQRTYPRTRFHANAVSTAR